MLSSKYEAKLPDFNPLIPGGNKKVTHTQTNLQPAAGLSMRDLFVTTRY